jgi:hypothetical protein
LVIASVDNLRFAEAVNRLDLEATKNSATLEDLQRGGAKEKTKVLSRVPRKARRASTRT